jgi:phospholipid/cholesterol/gamma-HCH transport system substrate-binding protein
VRSRVQRQQRKDLVKLAAFLVVSAMIAVWLGAVMGEVRPGDRTAYRALFDDVSGLTEGDQVRIAGVTVGKVDAIEVRADSTVLVTFGVKKTNVLNASTRATVKYRNLIGDRILELTRPNPDAEVLAAGAMIPVDRTAHALDLDTLLNGFKPLFAGLNPSQVNQLSEQLVDVLQGQASAVETLVSTVGSFATTIADRERLVTQVVGNLNAVLGTVDDRRQTVGRLIDEMDDLLTGLDKHDVQVLDAAHEVDGLARSASRLIRSARGDITRDLTSLGVAARRLNGRSDTLRGLLTQLPRHYRAIVNSGSYGNFFNFFLCGVRVKVSETNGAPLQGPWIHSDVPRCQR